MTVLRVPDGCAAGGPDPATAAWFRDHPAQAVAAAPPSHDPVLVDRIADLVRARGYDRIACFSRDRFHVLAVEILDVVTAAGMPPDAVVVVTAGEIADSGDGVL